MDAGGISVTFDTGALAKALREVTSVVATRNTIPVLSNVLFEIDGEVARISATDLDVFVTRTVPVESGQAAKFTLAAKRLADVVAAFVPGSQTGIEIKDGRAVVLSGRAKLRFATLPADQFPALLQKAVAAGFDLDTDALSRALGVVRHAVSTEETRYYLNGVFLHVKDGELGFAATDGHRLALHTEPLPTGAKTMPATILRRSCLDVIRAAADAREGAIAVSIGDGKVRFEIGDFMMIAKQVDGQFPDYQRVMPATPTQHALIDRDSLDGALARMALATNDRARSVKLMLGENRVTAVVNSAEHGDSAEEIPCEFAGKPFDIGFNLKYLRDALAALAVDTIDIGLTDAAAPTLLTSVAPSSTRLVLMPMRV